MQQDLFLEESYRQHQHTVLVLYLSIHLSRADKLMCMSTELYIAVVMSCDSLFLSYKWNLHTSFVSIHTFVLCRLSDVVVLRYT